MTKSCKVVHTGKSYAGKQGIGYFEGVSAESVGAEAICMHFVKIPPKGKTNAHRHEQHESCIYVISGKAITWSGDNLEEEHITEAGDFLYIPAGVPHKTQNLSNTEPCVAVIARTDPNEQESVTLLPHLEDLH